MSDAPENKPSGKGRPTPKRSERERANRKPLVGDRTKEGRAAAREAMRARNAEARIGMMNGDERYLAPRDKGPQKRFARDYVDSKFSAGELLLPAVFISLLVTSIDDLQVQFYTLVGLWVYMSLVGLNSYLLGRGAKKAAQKKFGEDRLERGIAMYAAMRSIQMRPMRLPKPQIKRGADVG
ncbi:MAG: hypothetical protein RLZZ400_21 [Actinomycetota bacterium]|jgi:hypothetical protein